jgi:pantoate--beta-alanine ligase
VTTGLVPTLGALHEGHASLVRAARAECDRVVLSIFVNPLQFDDPADFRRYPRDLDRDRELAVAAGADEIVAPTVDEMYPDGFDTAIRVGAVGRRFEGEHRPGHFDGVAMVVVKLLSRVRPDRLYLGDKDAQQNAVLRRVVADLDLGVELRVRPTVREPDGLAVSSRNALLSPEARRRAPTLHRALVAREPALVAGDLEYLAVVDEETFEEVAPGPGARVVGAARFDGVRLLDTVRIEEGSP